MLIVELTFPFHVATAELYPDFWIHIDAAWAGAALACPEYREPLYLNAINKYAHSFCMNPHKVGSF